MEQPWFNYKAEEYKEVTNYGQGTPGNDSSNEIN